MREESQIIREQEGASEGERGMYKINYYHGRISSATGIVRNHAMTICSSPNWWKVQAIPLEARASPWWSERRSGCIAPVCFARGFPRSSPSSSARRGGCRDRLLVLRLCRWV
jgi:hypothetical protein